MIRTFDFLFDLQRSEDMRKEYNKIMDSGQNHEFDYKGWHLYFDNTRKWVVINSNHTDEGLDWKFYPAEMSYNTLKIMMDPVKNNEEFIPEMRYLEDK